MPRNLTPLTILAVAGLLVACQATSPVTPLGEGAAHGAAAAPQGISFQLKPYIKRANERLLMAAGDVNEWTIADVARLHIELWNLSDGSSTAKMSDDLLASNSELDDTLTFTNLRNDSTYEVRAFAYLADNTTKISVDASSKKTITVIRNEVLGNVGPLVVTLAQKAFAAGGTATISIPSGGYSYNPAGETVVNGFAP